MTSSLHSLGRAIVIACGILAAVRPAVANPLGLWAGTSVTGSTAHFVSAIDGPDPAYLDSEEWVYDYDYANTLLSETPGTYGTMLENWYQLTYCGDSKTVQSEMHAYAYNAVGDEDTWAYYTGGDCGS